jgi:1,4-dihydroxy-6-naphthoate synthase
VPISLAYSVDADDAFMFHALGLGAIDARGLEFTHARGDTAWLNGLAARGETDVVAISAGAYPAIADRYLLLPHGASVGRGFGPVLVSKGAMTLDDLAGRRVAVPGLSTTAWLVLRLMQPRIVPVVVPIAPFMAVFDALDRGEVDAALLIHEGRLLFERHGCVALADLGQWWLGDTGLPLPLGVNVIRRALGPDTIAVVSQVLREAIAWALAHRGEVMRAIAGEKRGEAELSDPGLLDRYLGMYANADTRAMAPDARQALAVLFARAAAAGLLPSGCALGWAP